MMIVTYIEHLFDFVCFMLIPAYPRLFIMHLSPFYQTPSTSFVCISYFVLFLVLPYLFSPLPFCYVAFNPSLLIYVIHNLIIFYQGYAQTFIRDFTLFGSLNW